MSSRATRSKQRAAEIASLSPAKSTRSGGRSASPALNVSLRSSSPASRRSASPANSTKSVSTRGRGGAARGRGRGAKGAPARASPTPNRVGRGRPAKQQDSANAKLKPGVTRGRGRGRGRGRLAKAALEQHEDETEDPDDAAGDAESDPEVDRSHDMSGDGAGEPMDQAEKSAESDEIAAVTEGDASTDKGECGDSVSREDEGEVSESKEDGDDSEPLAQSVKSGSSEAAAIAEIASQLASDSATDQWPADPDNITFTDEHIQQLESVLSSDEGLKLLSDQQNAEDLTEDMTLDDKVIQVSLGDLMITYLFIS